MKKFVPLALLGFVLMAVSAWCLGWWMQARNVKQTLQTALGSLPPEFGSITADTITVSGFPNRMVVTITNPHVSLELQPMLTTLHKRTMAAAGNSAGVLTAPTYPTGTLTHALSGNITLSMNALADELSLTYAGNDATTLTQPSGNVSLVTEYNAPLTCRIRLEPTLGSVFQTMWDIQAVLAHETISERLREINCQIPGGITTDNTTSQIAASLAASHLILTNQPAADRINTHIDASIKDYEVLPTGDSAYNALRRAFTPEQQTYIPLSLSLYGKQSIALKTTVNGPKNVDSWNGKAYRVDIPQFSFSNAAGVSNGMLLLAVTPNSTAQQGEFSLNVTSEFAAAQTAVARMSLAQFLSEAMKHDEFAAAYAGSNPEHVEEAFFEALPNITALGTLTQKIRLGFSMDSSKNEGSLNVAELELSTRDYGLSANGQASTGNGNVVPAIDATVTCRNCLPMVDVLAAYMARVEQALTSVSTAPSLMFHLQPEDVAGAKGLLGAIGTPSASNPADLQFVIKSNASAMSINNKGLPELMQLVNLYFTPAEATSQSAPPPPGQ